MKNSLLEFEKVVFRSKIPMVKFKDKIWLKYTLTKSTKNRTFLYQDNSTRACIKYEFLITNNWMIFVGTFNLIQHFIFILNFY